MARFRYFDISSNDHNYSVASIFVACLLVCQCSLAQNPPWKTGRQLEQKLRQPAQIVFQGSPIREALTRFSRLHAVCIYLDRRIDPSLPMVYVSSGLQPLQQMMFDLAEKNDLDLVWIGPVCYVGPKDKCYVARVLLNLQKTKLQHMPGSIRRRWLTKSSVQWKKLSEPRLLAESLCRDAEIRLTNPDAIPHDLWIDQKLPPLDLVEKFAILLTGFGLSIDVEPSGNATIVPVSGSRRFKHRYAISQTARKRVAELKSKIDESSIEFAGSYFVVTGNLSQHAEVVKWLDRNRDSAASPAPHNATQNGKGGKTVYSLTIKNQPLFPVLESLARKVGMSTKWDAAIPTQQKNKLVTFQVENVQLQTLFESAVDGTGLSIAISDNVVKIQLQDEANR